MKNIFFLLAFLPLFALSQNTYFLSTSGTNFQIGNTLYPYNSVALIISGDTNAVGFNYVLIPPSTYQFNHTILAPKNFAKFYTVSGSDTTIFTSAHGVIAWYNANAVTATGNLDMEIGEEVIGATNNLPLYVDGSGNLAQYTTKPLLSGDTTNGTIYTRYDVDTAKTKFLRIGNELGYQSTSGNNFSPDTSKLGTKTDLAGKVAYSDTSSHKIVTGTYLGSQSYSTSTIVTGAYSTTGVSLQTAYVFAHGLGYNPQHISIEPTSLGSSGVHYTSWDATNITVNFAVSPGVVSITLHWLSVK